MERPVVKELIKVVQTVQSMVVLKSQRNQQKGKMKILQNHKRDDARSRVYNNNRIFYMMVLSNFTIIYFQDAIETNQTWNNILSSSFFFFLILAESFDFVSLTDLFTSVFSISKVPTDARTFSSEKR